MQRHNERVYRVSLPAPSESELVDSQYDIGVYSHHDGNPDSIVTAAVIPPAGKYRTKRHGVSLIDRAQTALIVATDGSDGINIYPAENSHEQHELPAERILHIPLHAALIMIQQENLLSVEALNYAIKHARTHTAHPHQGDQTSEMTKSEFRGSQIGLTSNKALKRRRLTPQEAIGPDLVPF